MRTQTRNHDLVYTCNLASASTSYQTISSSKSTWGSRVGSGTSTRTRTRTRTRSMTPLSFFYVIFVYFHLFLFLQFQDHHQGQFGSFFALAQTQTQSQYEESVNSRINDWREWNFYQILGLSPIDYYFPRNNKKKNKNSIVYSIPNRKTRRRERASVNSKDIKKAYRKQAQLWHPDKITSRKKQQKQNVNSNGNNNNNNMDDIHNLTVEECNARFAKIAEAYEVLNDEEKRYGYDTFLLDSEDQMELEERQRQFQYQRQQQHNNDSASSSSIFSSFRNNLDNFNPMSVFDDFFFGGSNNNYDGASNSNSGPNRFSMNDLFESFFGEDLYDTPSSSPNRNNHRQQRQNRDTEHQRPHRNQQPDRVNEATQIRYDPRIQQEIIRVLHREEFDEIQYDRIYYRVIAQEFVEEINMYHGGLEYVPISEPYFVEEGYSPLQHQQHQGSNQFGDDGQFYHHNNQSSSDSKPQQQQKGRRQLKHQTSSRMESYEYITPNTKIHLKSDNGQYYAGLTEECEFVIMQEVQSHSYSDNNEEHEDDVLIWSSGTFLPGQYQGRGCSFAVYAGRVAVVAGDVDQPKAILWNSPLPSLVPGSIVGRDEDSSNNNEEGQLIEYYVSLDDDGSLAVYRTRKHDPSQKNDDDEGDDEEDVDMMTIAAKWWSDLVNGEATIPTKTRAAEMWRSLQKWGNKKLLSKPKKTSSSASWTSHRRNKTSESRDRKKEKRDECVFATGPAGCLTPGRYVVRISKDIKQILDRVLEDFVDSVSEGSEDDLDYFDTATRVVARSTQYIGDVTMAAIKRNVYAVQLWTSRIRNLIEQLKELWYEAELVNKLHEKIEELKEFLFEVQ